ncbi:MAG: hypothetical protein D8M58_14520 [Calditrichaeota bacterium]|nr:MAG: hypothetical protein DWQ03_15760 [Calditrichota bacterium]MBL1206616.1 hypothetical protein [Calditrichota bacterium]NOG46443.1 hypothetical protein [Calditrichota bacterium]
MIIQDINLNGFKSVDPSIGLDLTAIENKSILSARAENKRFLFKSLLGIIYGLSDFEKPDFKDYESMIFTGRTNLKFDDYILHIERDFETGIVAVLSEGKEKQTPVFQGKDTNLGNSSRPYIHILESFFSINDKSFLIEVCKDNLESDKSTFGELLDLLYLFLRPKFKLAAIRKLIDSSNNIITNTAYKNNGNKPADDIKQSSTKLQLLKNAKKIEQSCTSLRTDIDKLKKFWMDLSDRPLRTNGMDASLKQRFPLIYHLDATKVKKEIQFLNSLQENHRELYKKIQELNNQKTEHDKLLNQKLLVYANLPDTFIEDFQKYQNLSIDLAHMKNEYDKLSIRIGTLQIELNQKKKNELLTYSISLLSILIAGLISFPSQIFETLGAMLIAAVIEFLVFRKIKQNIFFVIETTQLKQTLLKKKIQTVEAEIFSLRNESYLLDDLEYIDTHIERFKKYKQVKEKQQILKTQKLALQKKLESEKYAITIPKLERKYKNLLALNPEDGLEKYLDEFEKTQNAAMKISRQNRTKDRLIPLQKIIVKYQTMLKELDKTKGYIKDFLDSENLENDIDSQIATFERNLTHLKQKLNIENPPG